MAKEKLVRAVVFSVGCEIRVVICWRLPRPGLAMEKEGGGLAEPESQQKQLNQAVAIPFNSRDSSVQCF